MGERGRSRWSPRWATSVACGVQGRRGAPLPSSALDAHGGERDPWSSPRGGSGADRPRQRPHAACGVRHRRVHRGLDPGQRAGRDGGDRARSRHARAGGGRRATDLPLGVFAAGNVLHGAETADVAALGGRHAAASMAGFLDTATSGSPLLARMPIVCAERLGWVARTWWRRVRAHRRAATRASRARLPHAPDARDRPGGPRPLSRAGRPAHAGTLRRTGGTSGPRGGRAEGKRWSPARPLSQRPAAMTFSPVCRSRGHGYTLGVEHEEHADSSSTRPMGWPRTPRRWASDIEETRREWEAKEEDRSVPGAQPQEDEEPSRGIGPSYRRRAPRSRCRMTPGARPATSPGSPGVPGEEGTATGNPDAAGADEE